MRKWGRGGADGECCNKSEDAISENEKVFI